MREDLVGYVTQYYRLLDLMTVPMQKLLYLLVDDTLKIQAFELGSLNAKEILGTLKRV